MTHKEEILKLAAELPIEENFSVPDGLLIPTGQQVLLKRLSSKSFISKGGIIIPDANTKDPTKKGVHGLVMAIGPNVDLEAYPIKLGVKVEFRLGIEEDTLHNGESYILTDQFNIKGLAPEDNHKHPKYPTAEELRRMDRIEGTKRIVDLGKSEVDQILNG